MTDKNYTHKIVMYNVNGVEKVIYFETEEWAKSFEAWALAIVNKHVKDSSGKRYNMNNIVQINPVEVIEG